MCIQEKPSQFDVRCERCGETGAPGRMALNSFGTCFYCREELDDLRSKINDMTEEQLKLETEFRGKSSDAARVWETSFEGRELTARIIAYIQRIHVLHIQGQPWPRR